MVTICSILLLLGAGWTGAGADLFTHDGVEIRETGAIRTIAGAWTVAITISPPAVLHTGKWLANISRIIEKAEEWTSKEDGQLWRERVRRLRKRIEGEHGPEQFSLVQPVLELTHNRKRRGLFDFVGVAARSLFGVATSADVQKLQKVIKEVYAGHQRLKHHAVQMVSVMNMTRSLVQGNANRILLVQNQTRLAYQLAEKASEEATKEAWEVQKMALARTIDGGILGIEIAVDSYEEARWQYHRQKIQLERGILTEDLLPQHQLQSVLSRMVEHGYEILSTHWYYQHVKVTPLWEATDHLAFRLVLPGVSRDQYIGYALRYIPIRFNAKLLRQVVGMREVAIHTLTRATFRPKQCAGHQPQVCWPTREEVAPSCEASLVAGVLAPVCTIQITKRGKVSSTVHESATGTEDPIVVAYEPEVKVTLRCPARAPITIRIDGPRKMHLPAGCRLESKDWILRGVELGHTRIHLRSLPTLSLPRLNISWPTKVHPHITKQLQMLPHVNVPLLNVHEWEWTNEQTDMEEGWSTILGPGHYVTFGSNGVTIVVIIILLGLHVYYTKRSGREKAGPNQGEGQPQPASRPAPAAPNAPVLIQKLQLPTPPMPISRGPPRRELYPTRDLAQALTMGMTDIELRQLCQELTVKGD